MAYQNSYNQNRSGGGSAQSAQMQPSRPERLGESYVDQAESIMSSFGGNDITTSKIRNLLSAVMAMKNDVVRSESEKLEPQTLTDLQQFRVRLAYESGREQIVGRFVEQTKLFNYLKGIGDSKEEFIRFANYMEALVAYHKYYSVKR